MATQMTKSQLIEKSAAGTELPKKGVKEVFETLATIGYKELKRTGVFLVPGFAKFVVIKKPATKERRGTNPFTKGHDIQGQAGPEDRAGTAGQSRKRRGVRAALRGGANASPRANIGISIPSEFLEHWEGQNRPKQPKELNHFAGLLVHPCKSYPLPFVQRLVEARERRFDSGYRIKHGREASAE